ncbi:MAG: hydrogenase maturation nickel metallochaperone HypA [Planctomycetes bacterium]|nr:hydrogenase maturation nickel metallochaperone HypA [Planctomycetota bacterium]
MHEFSLARAMLATVEETARAHGARRVETIRLRIGILRAVVPDALRFAFEALGEGTIAAGAAIEIEEVPAHAACRACGGRFDLKEFAIECPGCGALALEIDGGDVLQIDSIEIDDAGAPPGPAPAPSGEGVP